MELAPEDLVANGCVTREKPAPDFDNSWKRLLIPNTTISSHGEVMKGPPVREGLTAYQLVGEVTAHQGIDG